MKREAKVRISEEWSLHSYYAMIAYSGDKGQLLAIGLPGGWDMDQKPFNIIEPERLHL